MKQRFTRESFPQLLWIIKKRLRDCVETIITEFLTTFEKRRETVEKEEEEEKEEKEEGGKNLS